MNDLQISNESFEFLFEESYNHESLALEEFPKLDSLDDDDNDNDKNSGSDDNGGDNGSDDDGDDYFSL